MAENKFENTGDFRGAALFQGSTIQNAGQIAGTIRNANQGSRDELQALLQRLGEHLKEVPPEKVEDAEAVSAGAEDLVKEAAKKKPTASAASAAARSAAWRAIDSRLTLSRSAIR